MNKESNMPTEIKTEFRRAIWTIVTAGVLGVTGIFIQTMVAQNTMQEQINVMRKEQEIIRTKIDLIQIQQGRKVDRETMDNAFRDVNVKLDAISDNILEIYKNTKK